MGTTRLVTDGYRSAPAAQRPTMTKHPARVNRMMLCTGVLGAAAALFLRPDPVVLGVFGACLLVAAFRSLRHAGQKIDRLLAEELDTPPADRAELRRERRRAA